MRRGEEKTTGERERLDVTAEENSLAAALSAMASLLSPFFPDSLRTVLLLLAVGVGNHACRAVQTVFVPRAPLPSPRGFWTRGHTAANGQGDVPTSLEF